jgi:predicted Ser/Thr protein kinase
MFEFNTKSLSLPRTAVPAGSTLASFVEANHGINLANYTLSAKAQIYRGILLGGINEEQSEAARRRTGNQMIKCYNVFSPYFGLDELLYKIVLHFGAAAYGAESSRQVLGLFGPPGGAKSALADTIKEILCKLEPMAAIGGSPMRDNIFNAYFLIGKLAKQKAAEKGISVDTARGELIESLRVVDHIDWNNHDLKELLAKHNLAGKSGMEALLAMRDTKSLVNAMVLGLGCSKTTCANIGYPDPLVEAMVMGTYDQKKVELADLPVTSFNYEMDVEGSTGIATLTEVDEKFFSNTKMYGSQNMRALLEHDPSSPLAAFFDGVFNIGSRGVTEFVEGIKNGKQCLRGVLELTQRHVMPSAGRIVRNTFCDTAIIIHSNMAEWIEKFVNVDEMRPYRSRIDELYVTYPRAYSAIVQVTKKLDNMSDFPKPVELGGCHKQPGVLDYVGMFAAATRIKPREGKKLIELVHLYNGSVDRLPFSMQGTNLIDFLDDAPLNEGMDGEDDRAINKRFIGAEEIEQIQHASYLKQTKPDAPTSDSAPCVTSRGVRRRIKRWIKQNVLDKAEQKRLLEFVDGDLENFRLKLEAESFFSAADVTYDKQGQVMFVQYMEEIDVNAKAKRDRDLSYSQVKQLEETARQLESDPGLGLSESAKGDFRSHLKHLISEWRLDPANKDKELSYKEFPLIAGPIRKLVAKRNKDTLAVGISRDDAVRNEEQKQQAETIHSNLIHAHHCPKCAHDIELDARESELFAQVM